MPERCQRRISPCSTQRQLGHKTVDRIRIFVKIGKYARLLQLLFVVKDVEEPAQDVEVDINHAGTDTWDDDDFESTLRSCNRCY